MTRRTDGHLIVTLDPSSMTPAAEAALRSHLDAGSKVVLLGGEELAECNLQTMLSSLGFGSEMPAAIAVSSTLIAQMSDPARETDQSIAGAALGSAIKNGLSIAVVENVHATLSAAVRSELIKGAIAQLNIEDFYPNHPWASHQEESLAACYHTLAALFMRIGDIEAAEDCLVQSEQFEDSPRALAMKALLSRMQGQTLGAVANMVSSLQQYEQRKKDNGSHYLAFRPNDIEIVNFRLKEGLEALNKRDNEAALSKFTEAVFNFDTFYSDTGLDKLN